MQSNPKEARHPATQQPQRGRDGSPSRPSPNPSPFSILLTLIATTFLVVSCQEKSADTSSTTQTHTSSETTLTLTLSATTLPTSGMLTATLSAEHPQSAHIELPSTTANFGDFIVFESNDTPPALNTVGKITTSRTFTLEPDLPGTSTLPSLTIVLLPDGGTPTEILTEPVPIEITSVLTDGETKPSDIVTDPDQAPRKPHVNWWVRILIVPIVVAVIWRRYYLRKNSNPHETATAENENLPENLTDLAPASMLIVMEPPIARIISRRHGIPATDFTSLEKSDIPGLAPLIARHRKLSYSDTEPTTAEATALLADFKTFLGKEAP
ncbi:MAG: hypothetical protein ACSHX9_13065 [Luteolibacter sp.]